MRLKSGRAALLIIWASILALFTAVNSAAQPNLLIGPSVVEFAVPDNGVPTAPQTVLVASSGGPLSYTVKTGYWSVATGWLSVTPASGTTPATLTLSVDGASLARGVYFGYVEIASATAQSAILSVTLRVGDRSAPAATASRATSSMDALSIAAQPFRSRRPDENTADAPLMAFPPTLTFETGTAFGTGTGETPPDAAGPLVQTITIKTSGNKALNYTASTDSGSWLAIGPQTGSTAESLSVSGVSGSTMSGSDTISVAVDPAHLTAGTHTGFVSIAAPGAEPLMIPVTVKAGGGISRDAVSVNKTSITLQGVLGGSAQTQSIQVTATPNEAYSASVPTYPWLSISSATGTTPATIIVTADPTMVPSANSYSGTIQIFGHTSNTFQYVGVTFNVSSGGSSGSSITASPTSVTFSSSTTSQTVQLSATTATSFSAVSTATWLTVTPTGGTTPATLTLSVSPTGLTAGTTYQGSVTITGGSSPVTIPVSYTVPASSGGSITASPTSVTFSSSTTSQTVQLSATTATSFSAVATATWLTVTPTGGTTPATLTLTVSPTGLTPGTTYQGSVTITGGAATVTVPVSYTVPGSSAGSITASPASVTFSSSTTSQTVQLSATTATSFSAVATATWLTVTPTGGTTPATLTLTVSPTGLTAGTTYQGSVTITGGASPVTIPVSYTVPGSSAGSITASPTSVTFSSSTTSQTVQLSDTGAGPTSFSAVSTATWLTVTPTSGATPATLTLTVSPTGLTAGTTYQGSVVITGGGTTTIPVSYTVPGSSATGITAAPSTLSFSQTLGGAAASSQTVLLSSTPSTSFTAASTAAWLSVSPAVGSTPGILIVSVNATGLSAGNTYQGSITVTGGGTTVTIPVSFTVNSGAANAITATPSTFTFSQTLGSAVPPTQTVQLSSSTPTSFTAASSATWLTVTPTAGTTPAVLTLAVNAAGLPASTYQGSVTITGGATTVTIPVNFTVTSTGSTITATPSSLTFSQIVGGATPSAQTVQLSSTTPTSFTASSTASWLTVTPISGTTPATLTLSVNATGLTSGTYQGSVTVTGGGTTTIPVTFAVLALSSSSITASPLAAAFTQVAGQNAFGIQSIQLSALTATNFAVTNTAPWLAVSPDSGTTPATLTLSANSSALTPGSYSTTLTITGGSSAVTIPVMLTVTAAPNGIAATPASVTFTQLAGGTTAPSQTVKLDAPNPTSFTASNTSTWLTVTPSSGTTPATLTFTINTNGLTIGNYQDTVTIAGGVGPVTIPVSLTLSNDTIIASPASLSFKQTVGSNTQSAAQTVQLSSTNPANYIASSTATWLSVSPSIGITPATLSVSANATGLTVGTYQTTITVNGGGSPLSIPVTLTVSNATGASFNPASLTFTYAPGDKAPAAQTVAVSSQSSDFAFTATATATNNGTWLSVTPTSGTTPATLNVTVTPTGLTAGKYNGIITVTPTDTTIPAQSLPVTLTVGTGSTSLVFVRSILNAASLLPGPVAPGEIITITGTGLGPTVGAGPNLLASGAVDTQVAGTRVLFDGIPAPLLFVRADQINAVVPYNVYGRTGTNMQVEIAGVKSDPIGLRADNAAPAVFTINGSGRGQAAIINQDGTINSASSPAPRGSIVAIYGTGEGQTNPPGQDGRIITTDLKNPISPVLVKIGGVPVDVRYMGSAPGAVSGLFQLNVLLPAGLIADPQALIEMQIANVVTQSVVTIAVK